jgi:hypothetical protein
MNIFLKVIIGLFVIINVSSSQLLVNPPDPEALEKMVVYDLQEFRYNFFKGDTLRFNVASFDSIIINYGEPLEKTKLEYIEITCDSVSKDRKFLMGIKLLSLISDESLGKQEKSRSTTSPWINRKISLWIDSVGNRYNIIPDDTSRYSVAPSGVYAPILFFPFKESYRYINESWLVNSTDTLCENGIPCALMKQSSLLRAKQPLDTLGHECTRFNYIKTGTGSINVVSKDQILRTEVTISGSGTMTISKKDFIPVHFFANLEQKLTIINADMDEVPGQHYLSADWTLDTFIPSKLRFAPVKKEKIKKKKK